MRTQESKRRRRLPSGWEHRYSKPYEGLAGAFLLSTAYSVLSIVIGVLVITGALLGWIRPLWFSSSLLILSNLLIGVAAFSLIRLHYGRGDARRKLIRDAVNRAVDARN